MIDLKKSAYVFFFVIILGLIVHVIEALYFGTFFGMLLALFGLMAEIAVFGIHMKNKKREKFEWKIHHIAVIALILIVIGIAINVICTFFDPGHIWIGNGIITLGFAVAVLGLFAVAIKNKILK